MVKAVPNLLAAVEGHVRTDLGPTEMIDLGQEFRSSCTSETLETDHLNGSVVTMYDDLLQMDLSFVVGGHDGDPAEGGVAARRAVIGLAAACDMADCRTVNDDVLP